MEETLLNREEGVKREDNERWMELVRGISCIALLSPLQYEFLHLKVLQH